MKKTNLIILIVGLAIILIIGGIAFKLIIKKKPAAVPPITPPSIAAGEEKIISRFMGLSPNEIPEVYKEKVNLYKENFKNDCLSKKEQVKKFLLNNNNENILKEMKEIAVSPDLIPLRVVSSTDLAPIFLKVTPGGEETEFKINKQIVFECLNLNKDEFKSCQAKLNGLEINTQNIENYVNSKVDIGRLIQRYLEWEAIKQSDENICQKINLTKIFLGENNNDVTLKNNLNKCVGLTQAVKFVINVYVPTVTCENLCQKITIDSADDCLIACQAIRNNDVNKCDSLSVSGKTICRATISFDPNYCDNIQPKVIDVNEGGKIFKEDQAIACKRSVYVYNAVKQNKTSLIKEAYKYKIVNLGAKEDYGGREDHEYIDKLYFQNEKTDTDFDKDYINYCNLKYSL